MALDKKNQQQLLLLVGALVAGAAIVYFHNKSQSTGTTPITTDELTAGQISPPDSYPSAGIPVVPSNFDVGGNTDYLTYNIAPAALSQMPQKGVATPSGSGCACGSGGCANVSGAPVFQPTFTLPQSFLNSQLENLQSVGSA